MTRGKHQKKSHKTTPGFRGTANPDLAQWMRQLGASSAAQRHTPRPRKGSRHERRRQAIRDHEDQDS